MHLDDADDLTDGNHEKRRSVKEKQGKESQATKKKKGEDDDDEDDYLGAMEEEDEPGVASYEKAPRHVDKVGARSVG